MKKRILALLCAAAMILSLCACSDNSGSQTKEEGSSAEQSAETGAEIAFDAAFEADKNYDIDAMAQVEYSINFSKSIDKDERVRKTKESLEEIDEESLESYKEQLADAEYNITDMTSLTGDELKNRIAQLEPQYRDTDKITDIIKLTFQVAFPDEEPNGDNEAEMICVDDTWYCYMGENTWGD